jgi:hypothetical protein
MEHENTVFARERQVKNIDATNSRTQQFRIVKGCGFFAVLSEALGELIAAFSLSQKPDIDLNNLSLRPFKWVSCLYSIS